MTKTKIRSAVGFGGNGDEDAGGGTHSSLRSLSRPANKVSRTTCCPPDQGVVRGEGTATAVATARERDEDEAGESRKRTEPHAGMGFGASWQRAARGEIRAVRGALVWARLEEQRFPILDRRGRPPLGPDGLGVPMIGSVASGSTPFLGEASGRSEPGSSRPAVDEGEHQPFKRSHGGEAVSREFASRTKIGRVRVNEQGHSGSGPEYRMGRGRQIGTRGRPRQSVSEWERRGPRLRWSTRTAGRPSWSHYRTSSHQAELSSSEKS